MRSPAKLMGHPIHPMLIPFPIALWVFSLVADVIYLWRDNPAWAWIAFYSLAGGILGAILAAPFGIIDYFSIRDKRVSRMAGWHARFNVLALLLFAASFYLRTLSGAAIVGGSPTIPLVLSGLGVASVAISGWLGGELVYKHGVAVEPKREESD